MKIVSSYKVAILPSNKISFKDTVAIYRKAIAFLIDVYNREWSNLSAIEKKYDRFVYAENLVHSTKNNKAKYAFDKLFYKLPCYLRRAAINAAIGAISSYVTNYQNWESSQVGKPPRLQVDRNVLPVFYNVSMHTVDEAGTHYIKLYQNNDWVWVPLKLRQTDMKYISKYWSHVKASAPILEKRYGRWYLRFALLKAYESGSYIFPNLVFCVKEGINRRAIDPAHNLLREAAKVTAHRMNPTYLNLDSTFNRTMPPEKFGIMGCRSRIAENRFSEKGALHRGNIAAISINLVQLALESGNSMECFLRLIDIEMENAKKILLDRYEKLLKGSGLKYVQEHALYQGSEQSHAADMLKNGTLSIGFIGLWESFCVLHDDNSLLCTEKHKMLNVPFEVLQQYAQEGLQVVRHMREIVDLFAEATNMNFSLLASSGEGISGVLPKKTSRLYPTGTILQDLTYYTNSFHLPVYVNISAFEKIELEAPFHELCNGGHISYVELAEAPMANGEAIEDLVEYACENNIGYFGINYPLDECPVDTAEPLLSVRNAVVAARILSACAEFPDTCRRRTICLSASVRN